MSQGAALAFGQANVFAGTVAPAPRSVRSTRSIPIPFVAIPLALSLALTLSLSLTLTLAFALSLTLTFALPLAFALSLPLAFLAAHNVAPGWVRTPVRQLFNAIRAVPELILAVIFIPITGLGAWAGTLAIGIHSIGTLGKWATESIESIDNGPIEAVQATGGQWVSGMRWAVIPQVMPTITSYWLFRFEINVRASAVLGMIGAGGVGSELVSHLIFRDFPAASAVLLMTITVVLTIDTVSAAVRRRIIRGSTGPGDEASRSTEALVDLTGLRR